MIKRITVEHVEYLAHRLAIKTMSWDEPIPEFHTRFPNKLESCLAIPFQRFEGKTPYIGLISKASILFYLLIKNHPFQNGNKRIALTTLLVFLYLNKKWLRVNNEMLYKFSVEVSGSNPKDQKLILRKIRRFISRHLIDIS